ncbi:MAG: S-layer homology domain-containing protein [Oscillospiraceae bacterium]|nr:S-layer homology domain-containing protein [Oscillospiraceae bacterium]
MKKSFQRLLALLCALIICLTPAGALSVEEALSLLEMYYIDDLPAAAYEAKTLDELFAAVGDPYTYYMDADSYASFLSRIEGDTSITGIGAGIEYSASGILLTSILPDSGAEAAGLKPGDLIIAVEGVSCVPAGEQHRELILGEEGTYVTVTVRRQDGFVQDYRIMRKTFQLQNTTITVKDGVGWIDCGTFGSKTAEYFYEGIARETGNVDGWVVDLRDNTGGLADAAVSAIGAFTGEGPKLCYRLGNGSAFSTSYMAPALTDKGAVVLVNGFSASSSEIFAGDIRAEKAGVVVGSRTYGKGCVQQVLDELYFPELFQGDALKVTVYRFYCSDGNTTDKIGVLPTLYVSDECSEVVAKLLRANQPGGGEYLTLELNGRTYFVDPAAALSAGQDKALGELLSALAPDVNVTLTVDGVSERLSSAQALERYCGRSLWRGFSDVAQSPYAEQINTLGVYRILRGNGIGYFSPESTLTRAQLCAMLAQALNITSEATGLFTDVPDNSWFSGDVNAIAALGFVNGVGGGRFDPNGTLTQEQLIAVMGRLVRFLNYRADAAAARLTDEQLARFSSLSAWARPGAWLLTEYDGDMLYTNLDGVALDAPVSREQAAATLCNILKTLGILSY